MPVEAAILVAVVILTATLIGLIVLIASRRRVAREDELRREASARGWQFSSKLERGNRVHRWTGSTDGVPWQAESMRQTQGQKNDRRRYIARWHVAWSSGVTRPIVCMALPQGKETTPYAMAQSDGFFAKMAQKAAGFAFDKAVDMHFGKALGDEVDAGAMQRVDATKLPGFAVMAADPKEGVRILAEGLERSLADASARNQAVWSQKERPWVLLRPNGISLARMERFRDINELESFVRAGLDLTRAAKFGRPSRRSGLNPDATSSRS